MELKVTFMDAGYCSHPECITLKGGRFANKLFPAMFIHLEHPKFGHILYDTGYSARFKEATQSFPYNIYPMVTPYVAKEEDFAMNKLKEIGVDKNDVNYIIISHFHGDHIGGIADFPNAKYIYLQDDYNKVKGLKGFRALLNGFLPGLMPKDFDDRSMAINDNYKTSHYNSRIESVFSYSYDIFGDGSIVAVDLPGHTSQQMGIYFRGRGQEYFLVADSVWMSASVRENKGPSVLSNLIHSDAKKLYETIDKLHQLNKLAPEIEQIPSHCGEKFTKYIEHCHWEKANLNGI